MAWRDQLRPASFRGVQFFVDSSQYSGGRRVSFHEFPDRDKPFAEDLGKVGDTFKVEGHILGDNYFQTKNSLINAVNKEGPGELVHPYYGTLQVQIGAFSIDEDTKEGGIAKISFQFYEAGDNAFPKEVDDKIDVFQEKVADTIQKSQDEFTSVFTVAKLPGFAVDTARLSVASAAAAFANATKGISTVAEDVANLAFSLRNLVAETDDLIKAPGKLAQRLVDSFKLLGAACESTKGKFAAFKAMSTFVTPIPNPIPTTTPIRQTQAGNKEIFDQLIVRTAIASAAEQAVLIDFESINDAEETRNELRDKIDEVLFHINDDQVFAAFKDLNALLSKLLPDVDADLPNVQNIILEKTVPSIVLAYDLFENPDAEADIVDRNQVIRHPAFVPTDVPIEVIDVRQRA